MIEPTMEDVIQSLQATIKMLGSEICGLRDRNANLALAADDAKLSEITACEELELLRKELSRLNAKISELEKDARRYRLKFSDDNLWLCIHAPSGLQAMVVVHRPSSTTIAGKAITECLAIDSQLNVPGNK